MDKRDLPAKKPHEFAKKRQVQEGLTNKDELLQQSSTEQIVLVEQLAQKITEDPVNSLRKMQTLFHLIEFASVAVSNLAILTVTEIFKELIPL